MSTEDILQESSKLIGLLNKYYSGNSKEISKLYNMPLSQLRKEVVKRGLV